MADQKKNKDDPKQRPATERAIDLIGLQVIHRLGIDPSKLPPPQHMRGRVLPREHEQIQERTKERKASRKKFEREQKAAEGNVGRQAERAVIQGLERAKKIESDPAKLRRLENELIEKEAPKMEQRLRDLNERKLQFLIERGTGKTGEV